jgi:membrane protein implicated in regulation of membrane protease activity
MYCPQCGTQTEQKAKFCKSCGLKLAGHARLLEEPREAERMTQEQWRREKRMMAGVTLMMVTAFDLIIFLIVFGSVTLSHLEGKAFQASLTVLLTFLFVSLALGAVGAFNLISSGFFKNIRERQLRAELAMLEQKRKALEEMNSPINQAIPQSPRMKPEPEMIDVTEHTTRELR